MTLHWIHSYREKDGSTLGHAFFKNLKFCTIAQPSMTIKFVSTEFRTKTLVPMVLRSDRRPQCTSVFKDGNCNWSLLKPKIIFNSH